MARYKLPDALGGYEVGYIGPLRGDDTVSVNVPGVGFVYVPHGCITEVPPPIPAEPEPGAYLIGDVIAVRTIGGPIDERWAWVESGDGLWSWESWHKCWSVLGGPDVTITPLVPAPSEVELPWATPRGDTWVPWTKVRTEDNRRKPVVDHIYGGLHHATIALSADDAEAKAYALMTAARAARSKP